LGSPFFDGDGEGCDFKGVEPAFFVAGGHFEMIEGDELDTTMASGVACGPGFV
jgi:hypothetical protein